MKKLVLGVVLALAASAPALAQSSWSHRNVQRLDGIRAQAPAINSNSVFVDGQYAGTDPDANVRLQLMKDSPSVLDR